MNRIRNYFPFIVVLLLWAAFCIPTLIHGRVPFPSDYQVTFFPPWNTQYAMPVKNNAMPDIITQIYPWKKLTIDTWKQGEVPLWNPNSFSGTVHAGNYQTAVFSPMNLLFFILPFIDAWTILILLQPLLAGIGMALFLRSLGRGTAGSTIGSIAFMFAGFMVAWMAYGTLGYAALFLPYILWSIRRFMDKPSPVWLLVIAAGVALSFVSGHFQISVYVLLASLAYLSAEALLHGNRKRALYPGIALVSGLSFASPQLFLTANAFALSVRGLSAQAKEVIPWQYIVTLLAPDFYGNPVTRNDWFGHYAEWASYVGVVPLVLGIYGALYSRARERLVFIVLAFVTLLLAYQSPLSWALFALRIPVLSTSAASRIILLFSFSLAVLSAFGADQLLSDWKERIWKRRIGFFLTGPVIVLCIVGFLYLIRPLPVDRLSVAKRNIMLPGLFLIASSGIGALGFISRRRLATGLFVALIGISAFDSWRFASKWMPFGEKNLVFPDTKVVAFLRENIDHGKLFGNLGNEVGSYYGLGLIEGYDAMYQGRYGEFVNGLSNGIVTQSGPSVVQFDRNARYGLQALQLMGVKYISHKLADGRSVWTFPHWLYPDEFVSRFRDEHYEVFEYVKAFPPVFMASGYVVEADPQNIIRTLFDSKFDRRERLVLERSIMGMPGEGPSEAIIKQSSPNKLVVATSSEADKLLFRSQVFDSGWRVWVDGKPAELLRADFDFQAVFVPKGTHTVEFRYWPSAMTYGIIAAIAGIGLLTGMSVLIDKRGKHV